MLMAREIERFPAEQPMFVTRITVELMRSVGRKPLAVRSRMIRPGRKVQLIEASLWNGDQEVARATAARIRTAEVQVPSHDEPPPHPLPEALNEWGGKWRATVKDGTWSAVPETSDFKGADAVFRYTPSDFPAAGLDQFRGRKIGIVDEQSRGELDKSRVLVGPRDQDPRHAQRA